MPDTSSATDEKEIKLKVVNYLQRCLELARLGAGSVSPNPMVGAVLVHEGRIIGEGWHQRYGQSHAEVHAVNSVSEKDRHLIEKSTLYVSLEPCNVFGRTPPCTDLILRNKIPKVVVSCLDLSPAVSGRGVEILRKAGVEVTTGEMEAAGKELALIRNTFVTKGRPFIILKFARSKDGFMGCKGRQVWISDAFSQRLAHRWRAECDAVLVGTYTALTDNPSLTTRLWPGRSPLRIALDRNRRIPEHFHLFDEQAPTWIITQSNANINREQGSQPVFIPLDFDDNLIPALLRRLALSRQAPLPEMPPDAATSVLPPITSLLVEGGAKTLTSFIKGGWWDEARIFTSRQSLGTGIPSPTIQGEIIEETLLHNDLLTIIRNPLPASLNFI